MPGPMTEVLNDEIKGLRDELRQVETSLRDELHRVETSLREDLHQVETSLSGEIHRVDIGLAELRSEVRSAIALGKWAGALLVTTMLTGGLAGVWWASGISAEVRHLADVVASARSSPQPPPSPKGN